jgi:hypothetical protein
MLSDSSVNPLITWGIINLCIGLYEIFAYVNRDKLKLEYRTFWNKIVKGEINIYNFWIEGWAEYCKVDSRYIYHPYVWYFELLNAFLAFAFIIALIFESQQYIKLILQISIINCSLYFVSLLLEYMNNRLETQYAKFWQYIIYYFISSIWIIVPYYLLVYNQM